MGWIIALLATVGLGGLLWRQRARQARELTCIATWLRDLPAGRVPQGPHYADSAGLLAIGAEITRLAGQIDAIRRDQTIEAANLQTILTSMAEGVMVVNHRHVIGLANPSLLRLFGLKTSPVGQSVMRAARDVTLDQLVTSTLGSESPRQIELPLAHVKPPRHLSVVATPIRDAEGENAVLVICHDITRLKQLEDVRREFVANVSHELRTPLAIFQGYLETLLDAPEISQDDLVPTLEILRKHSLRLNALVEDLLVLARLESRADSLQVEPIEPRGLVEDMIADWQIQAGKKRIRLTASCTADAPEFEADAFRLEQVLNNLVDNAIKYTESGGSVILQAVAASNGIEFRVQDTGVGVAPQDLTHIFERFYRADKARSREHGGTGLGLSIVKHIVQLHHGTVRAESSYGKGTTIIINLPLTQPTQSAAEPSREVEPTPDGHEPASEPELVK